MVNVGSIDLEGVLLDKVPIGLKLLGGLVAAAGTIFGHDQDAFWREFHCVHCSDHEVLSNS